MKRDFIQVFVHVTYCSLEGRMLNVHVISKETIRPSSPTPIHLRSYKLSLLDQFSSQTYIPLILFFSGNGDPNADRSHQLRRSLSETLTHFYPLAGRIQEDDTVNCNDKGVDFLEAQVNGLLLEFLKQPDCEVLHRFLPFDTFFTKLDLPLAIQVNTFDCSGVAVGICVSHKIADGNTVVTFLNQWGGQARGALRYVDPTFNLHSFFPSVPSISAHTPVTEESVLTKRILFESAKIAALRGRTTAGSSQVRSRTRFEAVSALIWGCFMRAKCTEPPRAVAYAVMFAVNLGGRMLPPLPGCSFGNVWVPVVTSGAVESELNEDIQGCLEGQLRDAVRGVDSHYIKELQGVNGILKIQESMKGVVERYCECGVDIYFFSSWCGFPIYDVDFGWGKPIWVSSCKCPLKDFVVLMENGWGDGIEAWVSMEEKYMARFVKDKVLLSYATIA